MLIPDDAVFVLARNNTDPLEFRYTESDATFGVIGSHTDTEINCETNVTAPHSISTYLGAILSADRSVIYWVNNTKPIP